MFQRSRHSGLVCPLSDPHESRLRAYSDSLLERPWVLMERFFQMRHVAPTRRTNNQLVGTLLEMHWYYR